jgi:hypothetical protein
MKDRGAEFLLQEIELGALRSNQDSLLKPGPVKDRRAGVAIVLRVVLSGFLVQDEPDDILGVSPVESLLSLRRNDIIRRSDDLVEISNFSGIVADAPEWNDDGHFHLSPFLMVPQKVLF